MPELGEIKKAEEIGKGGHRLYYIWHACIVCGKERWVNLKRGQVVNPRCNNCGAKLRSEKYHGSNSKMWKGGRQRTKQGYISVRLYPSNFFYPMVNKSGHVMEHRLVIAQHLGRCLHRWEIVHHKNNVKDDNRFENLQLVTDERHRQITLLEERIKYLEQRVIQLEVEITLLRNQLAGAIKGGATLV